MSTLSAPGRKHVLFLSGLVLLLFFSLRSFPERNPEPLPVEQHTVLGEEDQERDGDGSVVAVLPLPPEYNDSSSSRGLEAQSQFCRDRFSTKFLEDFRDRRAEYCSKDSTSELTCFHTVNSGSFASGSIDSFCVAGKDTFFDVEQQKFSFNCHIRDLSDQEKALGAAPFRELQSYQYLTGPKFLLSEWMDLKFENMHKSLSQSSSRPSQGEEKGFVILLKREVDGNLWHCLNEIMAILSTLDVLRAASDSGSGEKAIFNPEDMTRTEIVILDDYPDGPFFDLFRLAAGKEPLRLAEWVRSRSNGNEDAAHLIPVGKIVIPLAGAANLLWSDWVAIDCVNNSILRVFVHRIFDFYGIPRTRAQDASRSATSGFFPLLSPPRLNVSIVVRKNSRKLIGIDGFLFTAAKAKFSHVADIRLVDFEGKPFREQIEIARDTDIMVGMHGAGFTHVMFMEEGRGALVEIQPDRLCHKGFRNLAKMTGQLYFVAGANKVLGNCYSGPGGELEQMPDDGTAFLPYDTSRCWSFTTDPEDWSFACSDPQVTGGDKSYMMCDNRAASDDWYQTCTKKEASDIWWMTRYIMEQDKFLSLVGDAIEAVQEKEMKRKG
ncbi:hypothetical protein Daus18300_014246 [Diaporthe australafricana]|uniref:EGF domain-specific O-linked N-acetylglucosamine transferase n=1 Tax=Diaporthe australafricana TaxID=127596 RepID=A0ABR3VVX9_9PEZI